MSEQRYQVLDRLEAGGMAEVFVGVSASTEGFKKKVAIKRVLPHLAQKKDFIGMFLDEARLGGKLNHANIVSVFDVGSADNTYFIVMEFVDGCNLKKVIEILRRQGQVFPTKEALYLTMEACRGLSYAHELTDDDGKPLHLVHRDVSPPNILISKRGEVKVTDFGLAKATTQLEKTDPGVVKGKFSYLSPEAAQSEPVDARADVFAMGIVLWEMLSGRRLFVGESDFQTIKLIQQAEIPSLSAINPEVDAELEAVIGQALTRDPRDRYQSARELGDAVAGYLFSHQLKVTSYDIAALVKSTLDIAAEDKPKGGQQHSVIDTLIQEELLRFTSLDDVAKDEAGSFVGSAPLSPEDVGGGRPLSSGSFEDPSSWFGDDDLGSVAEAERKSQTPEWRPSGANPDLASLEDDDRSPSGTHDLAATAGAAPKSGGAKYLVFALLALGAAAAAYFTLA